VSLSAGNELGSYEIVALAKLKKEMSYFILAIFRNGI